MREDEPNNEVEADRRKVKRAALVFYEEQILIECPFCGKTLIRTNYQRIQKLLHIQGTPRGKLCPKCGGLAALTLSAEAKKMITEKLAEEAVAS
jgi:hypothetical protein